MGFKLIIFLVQVKSIHVDTRDSGTVYPYHRTLLNTLKEKDPIGRENAGHVSMGTELGGGGEGRGFLPSLFTHTVRERSDW